MRCAVCGSTDLKVLETREWLDGAMLRRRRECVHGHRFNTVEVVESKTITKYSRPAAKSVATKGNLWIRDTAIVAQIRSGKSGQQVAKAFHISPSTVSWILKRRAEELTRAGAMQ